MGILLETYAGAKIAKKVVNGGSDVAKGLFVITFILPTIPYIIFLTLFKGELIPFGKIHEYGVDTKKLKEIRFLTYIFMFISIFLSFLAVSSINVKITDGFHWIHFFYSMLAIICVSIAIILTMRYSIVDKEFEELNKFNSFMKDYDFIISDMKNILNQTASRVPRDSEEYISILNSEMKRFKTKIQSYSLNPKTIQILTDETRQIFL